LPPIGVGTPGVESLTGYIASLSEAHSVSVATLCAGELLPRIPGRTSPRALRDTLNYVYGAHILNGMGTPAEDFSGLLETLTGRRDLRSLTMLGWKSVISRNDLIRSRRAWCSCCYGEWRRSGQIICEPLLWTLRMTRVCVHHRCRLEEACPSCHRTLRVVSGRSQPGYCSRCFEWLGIDPPVSGPENGQAVNDWELWVAANLGTLLSATPKPAGCSREEALRENLQHCVDDLADGNHRRVYRIANLSNKSVEGWISGCLRPELRSLITLCHRLGIPLQRFLTERLSSGDPDWERARNSMEEQARLTAPRHSKARVRSALAAALSSAHPPTLGQIAAKLGYKSVLPLERCDAAVCRQISRQNMVSREPRPRPKTVEERLGLHEEIRKTLEAAVNQDEPPTLRSLATRLGFRSFNALSYRFPDLCRAVTTKRAECWSNKIKGVEAALRAAVTQDPPPTLAEVTKRGGHLSIGTIRCHFPQYHRELAQRRAEHRAQLKVQEVRSILLAGLAECPPPSFETLARRAGKSPGGVHLLFPDMYREILHRHTEYWRQQRARERQAVRNQVEEAVREVCAAGLYPSRNRVRSFLANSLVSENAVKEALTYVKGRLQPHT